MRLKSHLHSMMVTMSQKSSLINLPKSVPSVLTSDKSIKLNKNHVSISARLSINSLVTMIFYSTELWGQAEQKIRAVVTYIYIGDRPSYSK